MIYQKSIKKGEAHRAEKRAKGTVGNGVGIEKERGKRCPFKKEKGEFILALFKTP